MPPPHTHPSPVPSLHAPARPASAPPGWRGEGPEEPESLRGAARRGVGGGGRSAVRRGGSSGSGAGRAAAVAARAAVRAARHITVTQHCTSCHRRRHGFLSLNASEERGMMVGGRVLFAAGPRLPCPSHRGWAVGSKSRRGAAAVWDRGTKTHLPWTFGSQNIGLLLIGGVGYCCGG
jgi:hypothetical protein